MVKLLEVKNKKNLNEHTFVSLGMPGKVHGNTPKSSKAPDVKELAGWAGIDQINISAMESEPVSTGSI